MTLNLSFWHAILLSYGWYICFLPEKKQLFFQSVLVGEMVKKGNGEHLFSLVAHLDDISIHLLITRNY